jgi:hypothetical protein
VSRLEIHEDCTILLLPLVRPIPTFFASVLGATPSSDRPVLIGLILTPLPQHPTNQILQDERAAGSRGAEKPYARHLSPAESSHQITYVQFLLRPTSEGLLRVYIEMLTFVTKDCTLEADHRQLRQGKLPSCLLGRIMRLPSASLIAKKRS